MRTPQAVKRKKFELPVSIPLIKALVIHLVLVGAMMFSFQSHQRVQAVEVSAAAPKTIQAKAISSADVEKMVQEKQNKENAAKRAEQERKRRIQQEKDRKRKAAEDKKRREAEARKRKADADRKKREEAERKQREQREEAERKQREEAERKKREDAERKKREEAARIKAEQEAAARAAQEQRALTERDKYVALIKNKISRNWIVGNNSGQCILEVRLAPGGLILNVREISGGADLCRSAKAAVYKSEPLPVSTDPTVFSKMRTLELTLDPRDN
ncbi:MAG: cell envelope integrity protein TolA [Gammaproteobacteria bacterium]|jgi:colicin import membrane protein